MELKPQIFDARVMHRRLLPETKGFNYSIYYIAMPLPAELLPSRLQSFPLSDLGPRDGSDLLPWAKEILKQHGLDRHVTDIMLLTMPRVLGYVFNPVSFYLCVDAQQELRAVISEVHNTFGEQHVYVCAHADGAAIGPHDWLEAVKQFHVSPFLERNGHYRFRFDLQDDKLGIWIDYFDAEARKKLVTSLTGRFEALNARSLRRAMIRHPLVTLKSIFLIHWQALRLLLKGVRHITKPVQAAVKVTVSRDLTKI